VDLIIDKLLYQAIEESTEIVTPAVTKDDNTDPPVPIKPAELLSDIPIFYLGDKNMQNAQDRIVMGRVGNEPVDTEDSFDSEQRRLTFGFHLQIKDTLNYIKAHDRLGSIENACIKTIMNSSVLADYRDMISIGNITHDYNQEDAILQDTYMFVYVKNEEDYTQDPVNLDKVTIRGGIQND